MTQGGNEWERLGEDDPEQQPVDHDLAGCLSLHDYDAEVTYLTPTRAAITIHCPKCGDRTMYMTRWDGENDGPWDDE